jgi:hypothetical protein
MAPTDENGAVFRGAFNVSFPEAVRPLVACGFKVQHTARSNFFGIIPQQKIVTRHVPGNALAEYISVSSFDGQNATASFPTGGNGSVTTRQLTLSTYGTDWGITLFNGYMQGLKVTKADVTCSNGQACSSFNPPYIASISTAQMPVTLACTEFTLVSFRCSPDATEKGMGGEVKFETSLGIVTVPFTCGPIQGG